MIDRREQRRILEALVLAAPEPLPAARLAAIVPEATPSIVQELVAELNAEYEAQGRAFEVREVAGGWQLRTRTDLAEFVRELHPRRPARLSRAALETLAVVSYKQPITRAEIEHVRGVDAGAVLRSLLERDLVRIAGHREIPGRPMLYATTRRFLEVFGLASLEDLPTLRDLQEIAAGEGGGAPAGAAEPPDAVPDDDDPADEAFDETASYAALADEGDLTELDDDGEPEEPVGKPH